ncbi:MAG TPA: ATP-binding protein [Xanthobacteraceae bacterium]|nr:ATP-binding protein [Xanthobacteraceae bacterium]
MNHASALTCLRDPRLAAYVTSQEPAWVWTSEGTQVLWANAAAVTLFGAANLALLRERRFGAGERTSAHVVRLAQSLPANGTPRLERLRGFGTGFLRLLTCACSRFALEGGASAVLIAATESAGVQLSMADRLRKLLEGSEEAIAAFGTDGTLLYATPKAAHRMAGATALIAFEANALAAEALASGSSAGRTLVGPTSLFRVGQGGDTALIASFGSGIDAITETPAAVVPSPPVAPAAEPAATPVETAGKKIDQPRAQDIAAAAAAPGPGPAMSEPAPASSESTASEPSIAPATPAAAAPAAPPPEQPPAAPAAETPPPPAEEPPRQHPLRFVWQMEPDGRFTLTSDDFIALTGPTTARRVGQPWHEINAALALDPEGRVARAVATRDTWSGIVVSWPVDRAEQRLKVELSGLPIYDRQRNFVGYRGFGVCRDLETLAAIAVKRRERAAAPAQDAEVAQDPVDAAAATPPGPGADGQAPERAAPAQGETPRQTITFIGPAQNVVPFRIATPAETKGAPGLNAGERNAFTEIARQLSARLKGNERPAPSAPEEPEADTRAQEQPEPATQRTAERRAEDGQAAARAREETRPAARANEGLALPSQEETDARTLLDRLPFGVLVYRFDAMLYANRTFLDCVGYKSLDAFAEAGGIDSLFIETLGDAPGPSGTQMLAITTGKGDKVPVDGRLFSIPWTGENALALVLAGPRAEQRAETPAPAAVNNEAELRKRIAALEDELAQARRAAQTAGDEKAELLGKVGREVRTPLTAIMGFVETMLSERYGPIGNERYRTFLTDIHYSGSRILALFDDLASLAKIDRSKPGAGPSIKLNEIVQACVTQMQGEASRVRVLIRTSLASTLPGIAAEPDSVKQVVLNLLANSIRFAGAGGQVIVSTAVGSGGKVLLRLRDTGPGLSAGDLAQLQPGTTASASADAADQQLTLAVARALLEANHASLSVTTKSGEGTLVEAAFASAT